MGRGTGWLYWITSYLIALAVLVLAKRKGAMFHPDSPSFSSHFHEKCGGILPQSLITSLSRSIERWGC